MAAYAAVVSLLNTINDIQNHPLICTSTRIPNQQIQSLSEIVCSVQQFLETQKETQKDVERQIAGAAYAAQDFILSHVADSLLGRSTDSLYIQLRKVIQDMDPIKEKLLQIQTVDEEQPLRYSNPVAASTSIRSPSTRKTTMVGFQEEQIEIMDKLTRKTSSLQVTQIVGMGGIGKTTLAKSVYESPLIVHHFDIRIWVTISQQYVVRDLLLQIPICQKKQEGHKDILLDEYQLGEVLYKTLSGRRYLIVLDDIWSLKSWDDIQIFFPDNAESRILVTSRLSTLDMHFGSCSLKLNLLDQDKSWELFCQKVSCPLELESTAKQIVEKCRGLPLTISVISGLLAKADGNHKYWESVAEDLNSMLINSGDEDDRVSVLSLSYTHLSIPLKPCFLYMGIFPEDYEIHVSELVKLWIAEGFLKPDRIRSVEDVADEYIRDLVDRNIILVRRWGLNGKIKTCYIHDLLRDLCLRIAREEEFLYVMKKGLDTSQYIERVRRIVSHGISPLPSSSAHSLIYFGEGLLSSSSSARSPTYFGEEHLMSSSENGLLMQVLKNVRVASPNDILNRVNLRFISFRTWDSELPSLVYLLWNLQTLKIDSGGEPISAPIEFWKMLQLKYVEVNNIHLPQPPISCVNDGDDFVLKNLHTLKTVVNFIWSQEVLKRIPYVTKIRLLYSKHRLGFMPFTDCHLDNLSLFEKLESLHIDFPLTEVESREMMQCLRFPNSLKKLTLSDFGLCWDDLAGISSLPNLEVVKFLGSVLEIEGSEWILNEGVFCSLKSLQIDKCNDLIYWDADDSHFPVLEILELSCAPNLDSIPLGFGEIPSLRIIRLGHCKASAAISAMKVLNEQEDLGNEDCEVGVIFKSNEEEEIFKELVKLEGLRSEKFYVVSISEDERERMKPSIEREEIKAFLEFAENWMKENS